MPPSLAELTELAATADGPGIVSQGQPLPGGVDPLGLRQINFDLMDRVFPGINNVARHIRPFTVVAWAWRRAAQVADMQGQRRVLPSVLHDFVARIEVAFAWSQFVRDPQCSLPGRDVIAPLLGEAEYRFGGKAWERRRDARTYSTALSAPVNYGPAVKAFGWVQAGPDGGFAASEAVQDAMAAMDEAMSPFLDHPALSSFSPVTVTAADIRSWGEAWALDRPTETERAAMLAAMHGERAPKCRREGVELALAAARLLGADATTQAVRRTMCGTPGAFRPPPGLEDIASAWRAMQVRQTFRLALEGLFHWLCLRLRGSPPTPTGDLVADFLAAAGDAGNAGNWLAEALRPDFGPVEWLDELHACLADAERRDDLPATIRGALAACIAEAPENAGTERRDRLPLARAAEEADGWKPHSAADFFGHVVDSWVFGQHVYWSVGRGLADARARGKSILRLRVAVEEGGWTLMPGAQTPAPRATPDRLDTMLCLMGECGLLEIDS